MLCPKDQQAIQLVEKNNTVGYRCDCCDGVFLHGTAVRMFKFNYNTQVLSRLNSSLDESTTPIACPACQQNMTRKSIDQIELDVCSNCEGIWFDPAELEQVINQYGRNNNPESDFIDTLLTFLLPGF